MSEGLKVFFKEHWHGIILYTVIGVCLFQYFQSRTGQERLHQELIGKTVAYQQLSEHAAKLEIQFKSQEDLKAELEKNWKAEKDALQGRVKVLSNATYLIREAARKQNNSDLVFDGDKLKYVFNEIRFKDGPPIGYVLIWDDGKVISKIYNHQISVNTAISRDESTGYYNVLSKADFILKSPHLSQNGPNWLNVKYPLKIVGGTAVVDPTEPNAAEKGWHLWAPVLNGGMNIGLLDVKPALGVSLAGYGYSVRDLDWKFLQLGVDYTRQTGPGLHVIPVLYRPFPCFLRNTYLGIGVNLPGYLPFASVSVGF